MENQMPDSYLLRMPPLIIEKILSDVLNLTNVSYTCNTLYEIVCDMEKRKRILFVRRSPIADDPIRLTIDDDVVFASIKNSFRVITEVRLYVHCYTLPDVELNERQVERLTEIIKHFGTNITDIMMSGVVLPTDKIIELLNQAPKLQSLEFRNGQAFGKGTMSMQLPNLKKLTICYFGGLLDLVKSIPAGSLHYFRSYQGNVVREPEPEILQAILSEQYNIKSLQLNDHCDPDVLRVNHLQLEKLQLGSTITYSNVQLLEILKCHKNVKEFRLSGLQPLKSHSNILNDWICENLKELEVLEVPLCSGMDTFWMLKKLNKLRYLSTNAMHWLPESGSLFRNDLLETLKIGDRWIWYPFFDDFNGIAHGMGQTFTNLTHVEMTLSDFTELSVLLSQCSKLTMLNCFIENPDPQDLSEKSFPNIRHATITTYTECDVESGYEYDISRGVSVIISIIRAMPNLKTLWMPCTTILYNVNEMKEFLCTIKSLEEMSVSSFKLDHDLAATGDFVATIRLFSDLLKAYKFTFTSNSHLYSNAIKEILSNEFNILECHEDYDLDSSYFDLCKGVLTEYQDLSEI